MEVVAPNKLEHWQRCGVGGVTPGVPGVQYIYMQPNPKQEPLHNPTSYKAAQASHLCTLICFSWDAMLLHACSEGALRHAISRTPCVRADG